MSAKEIRVTPHYYDHVLTQDYQVVIQVGGRFSGKSHNEEIRLVSNLGSKDNYKLLVIEDLETGMSDGFHAGLYARIHDFEHTAAYTPQSRVAHIKNTINGNEALFRGYATEQQRLNVKKLVEVTEILVEEGEWMDYTSFVGLLQQLRGGHEKDRRLTILMNPVNPDCFVNEMFIEAPPDVVKLRFSDGRPKVFEKHIITEFEYDGQQIKQKVVVLVVLSTHHDNPFLTLDQRASIEQLKDTDPELYKQLGEAKFIRPTGTYFKEFTYGSHVVEPFVIPDHWTRYRAIDYGLDMLACLWIAVSPTNYAYVYKELHEPDLIISEASKRIREVNGTDNIRYTYAPPDLQSRTKDTGRSIWDTFHAHGVIFYKSSNARVQGWLSVKEAIKLVDSRDLHTGAPIKLAKMQIFSNCSTLIKHLPAIQRSEKDPNDCATEPHDITHICDALRYFTVMRYNYNEIEKDKPRTTAEQFFGTKDTSNNNSFVSNSINEW